MEYSATVHKAISLAKTGHKAEARQLVASILLRDPENVDALIIMAQIVDNRAQAIACLKKVLAIRPDDEYGKRYLAYLQRRPAAARSGLFALPVWAGVVALLFVFIGALCVSGQALRKPAVAPQQLPGAITCRELIDRALKISDSTCNKLGENEVCYGHTIVSASLVPGTTHRFDQEGDILSIDRFMRISASPLNLDTQVWGIGIFKLEANLPYTVPGQNVIMLVTGNTSLQNISHTMQAFTFSSGLGGINCENVPLDGLVVRTQEGSGIRFNVNGSDLALSGVALLQSHWNNKMEVSIIKGAGYISSNGVAKFFNAGETVAVPLKGLMADGPPVISPSQEDAPCELTGDCRPAQPAQTHANALAILQAHITEVATVPPQVAEVTVKATVTPTTGVAVSPTIYTGVPTVTPTLEPSPSPVPTSTASPTLPDPSPSTTPTPTETPTSVLNSIPGSDCGNIALTWDSVAGNSIKVGLANNTTNPIQLTYMALDWPASNGNFTHIRFMGNLWNGAAAPPSFSVDVSGATAVLGSHKHTDIQFRFTRAAASAGYSISITVDSGCILTLNQ